MSDINTNTPTSGQPDKVHPLFELLGNISTDAKSHLADTVALHRKQSKDKLIQANAEKLATAVTNYTAIDRALKAIKPTALGFDVGGKPVNEVFSKDQITQRKQLEESKAKALKIFETALTTGDFSQFSNIKAPAGAGKATEPAADEQPAA